MIVFLHKRQNIHSKSPKNHLMIVTNGVLVHHNLSIIAIIAVR